MDTLNVINDGYDVVRSIVRLEHAFIELVTEHNIKAEQDFTCCGSCGHYEMKQCPEDCKCWKGYCFYHMQSSEGLLETGEVYLQHNAMKEEDSDMVARTICDVLEEYGFEVEWEGDTSKAIRVQVITKLSEEEATE